MTSSQPLTILTAADVDRVLANLDLEKAIASQAAVFDAFSGSTSTSTPTSADGIPSIQNPHRTTIETNHSTSLFMPARAAELGGSTCKIVSVPKQAGSGGLPAVTVVLDDMGVVRGMVNARRLTAMRNACGRADFPGSALFLRRYPLADPLRSCVFFGSGEQIYAHASVFLRLYGTIQSCTIVVREENARAVSLLERLKADYPQVAFRLSSASPSSPSGASQTLAEIVNQAQVIVTATSSQRALFEPSSVRPGARVILIGSYKPHMREVEDELVRRASTIVVDSKKACMQEAGELISAGLEEDDLEELGGGVQSGIPLDGIILFKSVGLGVQDVAIAKLVLDEAISMGVGTRIDGFDG